MGDFMSSAATVPPVDINTEDGAQMIKKYKKTAKIPLQCGFFLDSKVNFRLPNYYIDGPLIEKKPIA